MYGRSTAAPQLARAPARARSGLSFLCASLLLGSTLYIYASLLHSFFVNAAIANQFREIVGPRGLITSAEELRTYECDGLTNFRVMPLGVLLPENTSQVQA